MTGEPCSATVYPPTSWTGYPCSKPAKVERDGKFWCTIHDPERIKAKRDARDREWRAKWDAEKRAREAAHTAAAALSAKLGVQFESDGDRVTISVENVRRFLAGGS